MKLFALLLVASTAGADPKPVDIVWRVADDHRVTLLFGDKTIQLDKEDGGLQAYNQSVCHTSAYPLDRGEVGKITFYEGGAFGYFLRSKDKTHVVLGSWFQSDGACEAPNGELTSCPRQDKVVQTLDVPAGATFRESIVLVDAKGQATAIHCK